MQKYTQIQLPFFIFPFEVQLASTQGLVLPNSQVGGTMFAGG